ncbi:hypothetical protein Kpol_1050p97 [Vanderwaltozyma polyspora DSM 70294]|uniref:Nucleoporin Nup54 alpha-helical domain-containing protein n=1 Tax=Vanderwaltozyma polyspora (strain ATCC 22028 / DSM 70294 / BCRC 21397 / CBS 2163 / NBRC 10782 / NRRL Y-8283 / UCD 57-17) TaxID=436907 RepID=A7TEZ1_VANPO|nr:uncharacterized protein Kpol_1050p97 [Vanderwaltozyma polyspora DSM 70294]EDO19237.1 hypothetical protein Kpol_1050p97 [Vanderwaltozyma polyspora DSM 70294]
MFSFGGSGAGGATGAAGTGTSMFGNQQQQQPQQQQQQPQQAGFGFGQSGAGPAMGGSTGGSLFGGAQPTSGGAAPSGGLFGNTQQQQNTSAPGGGLFGQASNTQAAPGGLFGGAQQNTASVGTTGGMFGSNQQNPAISTNTGGGLFGSKQTLGGPAQVGTSAPGGGLFGNTQQSTAAPGGGLFGQKPAGQSTGGLFGGTTTQTQSTLGGASSLFSKPVGGAPTTGATGGLFGNTQQSTLGSTGTTGGLFGNKPAAPVTGSLFGNAGATVQQPQPVAAMGGSGTGTLFGANTIKSTQPSFAWSQPQQSSQPMFQQQQQQQIQQQLQQQQLLQQQQQHFQHSYYPQQIQEQVIKCKESWDPTSNKTKLKTFVYNKVNETEAILYNKPANVSQDEWDSAVEKKPSKDVIPVEVMGFEGLNQRNQVQRENIAQARVIFNQLLEKSTQLQQKHELDTSARILKAQSRNAEIERRILNLGVQIAILKSRGLPLNVTEEKMWDQFQKLLKRSEDPAGLGKTNELWARLAVLKDRAKHISEQLDSTLVIMSENGASKTDDSRASGEAENRIDKIAEILSNQQRGISYLNDVLIKDHAAIDKVIKK